MTFPDARELTPELWRWTAPHPGWRPRAEPGSPGDWDQIVGCILYLVGRAAVFVDPLLPDDHESFWAWADERTAGRHVFVLTTLAPHRRSRKAVAERYGASVSRAKRRLPPGVESIFLRGAAETMFWLPHHGALIPGDRILGDGKGGLRVCPESWLQWVAVSRIELKALLEPLLRLPIERVLVSHGQPVLSDGVTALARALDA